MDFIHEALKDVLLRTVYTFIETLLAVITAGQLITSIDWKTNLLVSATSAFICCLRSIASNIRKYKPDVVEEED
jgi:hypothetical protein